MSAKSVQAMHYREAEINLAKAESMRRESDTASEKLATTLGIATVHAILATINPAQL